MPGAVFSSRDWKKNTETFQVPLKTIAVLIGLSLPSVTAQVLIHKINYLYHLLSSKDESIATSTFRILASHNVYIQYLTTKFSHNYSAHLSMENILQGICTYKLLASISKRCHHTYTRLIQYSAEVCMHACYIIIDV